MTTTTTLTTADLKALIPAACCDNIRIGGPNCDRAKSVRQMTMDVAELESIAVRRDRMANEWKRRNLSRWVTDQEAHYTKFWAAWASETTQAACDPR